MDSIEFENPFLHYLGVKLVRWEADQVEFHLPVRPHLMNRIGQVQGGVLCALLDVSAGYSGIYSPPGEPTKNGVTLSLATSFLDVGKGELLVASGRVQRRGRSVFFAESEVLLDGFLVLARAIGSFRYIRLPQAA